MDLLEENNKDKKLILTPKIANIIKDNFETEAIIKEENIMPLM